MHYAENELLRPAAFHVPGCVCGAHHPPGPALAPPPLQSVHHPVGRSADQGVRPAPPHLHLPREPAVDEQLRGAAALRGPLLPLPGVHHSSLGTRAVHPGGTVGMALLGKGG